MTGHLAPTERVIVLDIETTGLGRDSKIIEIGFALCNLELEIVDSFHGYVWDGNHSRNLQFMRTAHNDHKNKTGEDSEYAWVLNQHEKSGLWNDAIAGGVDAPTLDVAALKWLDYHNVGKQDPMVGSSVHFDRKFLERYMPKTEAKFSHRNIDVSSVKELSKRWVRSSVLENYPTAQGKHRVLPDIDDTIQELKYLGIYYMGVM